MPYGSVATSFVYTVTYNDATTVDLKDTDITLGGPDTAGCTIAVTNGTTMTPTVTINDCAGDGLLNISIAADTAEDADGLLAPAYGPSANTSIQNSFIFTVDTTKGNGTDTFELPLTGWAGHDFTVYWGDGDWQDIESATWNPGMGAIIHSYPGPDVYEIKIKGAMPYFRFGGGGDRLKILDVKQWGTNQWGTAQMMFAGCENLQVSAIDRPDLSNVTDMRGMFMGAKAFNSPVDHWITSNVQDMSNIFMGAEAFNQPVGGWDTANATTMASMFSDAKAFNQDISEWDTFKVTDMSFMFMGALVFDQPLVRNGNYWNTSKVTDMSSMFQNADAFNHDISNWIFATPGLLSMEQMFFSADSFVQDISGWVLPMGVDPTLFDHQSNPAWDASKKPTFP
ncbi:putative membrane associated lipoprotein [Bdellovibrio bacteriovorus str. Tiberius]|uniref:Putative membrane associated lipoprotein n=1 Tax=Bdellovibrio bacteriovorus str. Tiberius TaxID=1069642 RepID=K7Z954_BDEBC|nr:putative membrane associated lipoprotein [Bdellovibrio bacteriovorus str. Tiberius]